MFDVSLRRRHDSFAHVNCEPANNCARRKLYTRDRIRTTIRNVQ